MWRITETPIFFLKSANKETVNNIFLFLERRLEADEMGEPRGFRSVAIFCIWSRVIRDLADRSPIHLEGSMDFVNILFLVVPDFLV